MASRGFSCPILATLAAFGAAVVALLEEPERARRMGAAARARIVAEFLGPYHLGRHFELIQKVISDRAGERPMTVWAPSRAVAL